MIVEMIFVLALGLAIGFYCGKSYTDNKITIKLRNRGYSIVYSDGGYSRSSGWYFKYNGFDDKLRAIADEGPLLRKYADAVANADAHYYVKTIKNQLEF